MKPITKFVVSPKLPENLQPLKELAYNYWWCWNVTAKELFMRVNKKRWEEEVYHNPVALLQRMSVEELEHLSQQKDFVRFLDFVYKEFRNYMDHETWYGQLTDKPEGQIAYFSAEFAINESFPIYSGGLGVLAGDHLKSASDLGVPLVGVGLLYQRGYFRQFLAQDGWQNELYPVNDFYSMPIFQMKNEYGEPLVIDVDLPLGRCFAQVWKAQVGRVPLYLMDTNIEQNIPEYRTITAQLYGGTQETRIQQEILLGIGGVRMLRALGLSPKVCHLNEGHAAFAALERTRNLMNDQGLDFYSAMEVTRAATVFTTHTPVPAGNEVFPVPLVEQYFQNYPQSLGISLQEFFSLGRQNVQQMEEGFSMTVLGLRVAQYRNGVSKLHGVVSRKMWHGVWPGFPEDEVPVTSITNGIHTHSWIARELAELYDRYLTPEWRTETDNQEIWNEVDDIPNEELWRVHSRRREMLVYYVRRRLLMKHRSYMTPEQLSTVNEYLDPEAFTIGFARRFATYKRADLLFRDIERLKKLLTDPDRPVQILIAGKAHPRDNAGKQIIQSVVQLVRQHGLEKKIIFLEDYDMAIARYLVKGCDIWLNNPRRPYEASGTSGMKAALNGCIHVSILDGWWAEAYNGRNGFAIGHGEEHASPEEQDEIEAETLHSLLEQVIIPLYYDRSPHGVPEHWVRYMKECIKSNAGQFSTMRMVRDYTSRFYLKALAGYDRLAKEGAQSAKSLRLWKETIRKNWSGVHVRHVEIQGQRDASVGSSILVGTEVELGNLSPSDVRVEAYHGSIGPDGEMLHGNSTPLALAFSNNGVHVYKGEISCLESGYKGCTVRVLPANELLSSSADAYECTWA